jgi:predicted methyltransferase
MSSSSHVTLFAALVVAACGVGSGASAGTVRPPAIPKAIAAAVADPARPQADRDRDIDRKPAECVAFAGLKPGQKIVDLIPGGGYFTRIFSAVVGPKGQVFAVAPPKRPDAPADRPEPAAPVRALAADPHYANVSVSVQRVTELKLPANVDMVWTSQNYHDVHNVPNVDVAAFNKAIFDALKPGGIYIVIDHAAAPGSGLRDTSTLHRIDAEAVKNEVLAAGFRFEGSSEVVRNPADDHTLAVFDKNLHDKTDRFVLKFRKPRG